MENQSHQPWNKGKLVGQKAPLKLRDIWAIRIRLQLQSCKPPHRLDLVQRIFHRRIGQRVPLLHEVDAQHARKRHRWSPTVPAGRVRGLQQGQQCTPRHYLVHLGQEHLAARAPLLGIKVQRRERGLLHRWQFRIGDVAMMPQAGNKSDIP